MNRAQLHRLAELRVREADALLALGEWSGAYYLVGYAVECGLKACVLNRIADTGVIFTERKFSEWCFTHNLGDLIKVAGLEGAFGQSLSANIDLKDYWKTVKDWNETARYAEWLEFDARALYNAIADPVNGVLLWVRNYW